MQPTNIYHRMLGLMAIALVAVSILTGCGRSGSGDDVQWFMIREPAEQPMGTYYGYLCKQGSTLPGPSVIVDFGRHVRLATGDLLEARYMRTERTGKWMDGDYRIYVPDGEVRPVDSARTQ